MKKRLVLIDGHAVIYRAYYAYPASLTTPEGRQINAVYGFVSILLAVVRELAPSCIAVAFDLDKPTFRHVDYVGYKAQRPKPDKELIDQIGDVKEVVKVLNMPIFEVEGFEADDVIGTLSRQAVEGGEKDIEVVIATGDQDAMQLVNKMVKVYVPKRGRNPAKMYGIKEVKEKYELEPEQIVDLKALMGDSADNIPGVKGIGPKTATDLLKKFKTVERVYSGLDKARNSGEIRELVAKKLTDDYEEAMRSKKLARIVTDVPITLDLKACKLNDYNKKKAVKLFEKLGFQSLIKRLPSEEWEDEAENILAKGLF